MSAMRWLRFLVAGVVWALLYNGLWLSAWITFMRREWMEAAAVSGQSMPWTPEFWAIWIPMTVLLGLTVGAYLLSRPTHDHIGGDAVASSLVIWVPSTIAMAFMEALTPGIIVLDSFVNLVAVLSASLVLAGGVRPAFEFRSRAGEDGEGGGGAKRPWSPARE